MTPKEIVERVKQRNDEGRAYCAALESRTRTTLQECDHIDHLLAIHAAGIALLDAVSEVTDFEHPVVVERRIEIVQERRAALAALCGWKAKEETK